MKNLIIWSKIHQISKLLDLKIERRNTIVLDLLPEELEEAKKLMREGKYEEALGTIKLFENKAGISDEEKLSALILEGNLYTYTNKFKEVVKVGDTAYKLSQKLESINGSIEALLLKSHLVYTGSPSEALDITRNFFS